MIDSNRWHREIFFLFLVGMFLFFVSAQIRAHEDPWKGLGVIRLSGDSPPDFTLSTLHGGSITLSDLKGEVVLINFWTTWCPPCRDEMPSLKRLFRRMRGKGFTILAVDIMESREVVKKFAEEYNLPFPVLVDSGGEVSSKYTTGSIPVTYIADKLGKAVGKVIGARDWDGEDAEALLTELLED